VRVLGEALFPPEVLARYDLVGVDARGTGRSRPVRCLDPQEQQDSPFVAGQTFPITPAEEAEAVDQARRFADECRARNGDLLDHVGTLPAARDLDVLRAALGDRRINLVGLSYGTFLGQVVANTFPDRVGALVLDGVVDPAWATGGPAASAGTGRTPTGAARRRCRSSSGSARRPGRSGARSRRVATRDAASPRSPPGCVPSP
jgi:pimeloyl-ACP methyl ester carboxylesterase